MTDISSRAGAIPYQVDASAPQWFVDNIQCESESIFTYVDGRAVHMLGWNLAEKNLPVLMFVHGFGAHAHWWSFLAPFFLDHYRVISLDLPGMGDSAAPHCYDQYSFARAIIAGIESQQLQEVTVVGHSFGGAQSLRAMAMAPHYFKRGIVVDSNINLPPDPPIRSLLPKGTHRLSSSQADCMARLRLMPPQAQQVDALVRHIAYHSCTGNEQGWHWKSDPNCLNTGEIDGPEILASVEVKVDLIYGEKSYFNVNKKPQKILSHLGNAGELVMIPGAEHHIMVDHPLELVAAIRSLLASE